MDDNDINKTVYDSYHQPLNGTKLEEVINVLF